MKRYVRSFLVAYPGVADTLQPLRNFLWKHKRERDPFEILRHVRVAPGAVLVDAGAHRGQSVAGMRRHKARTPIICFEPLGQNFEVLERHTAGDPNVTRHRVALSDTPGTCRIYMPCYKGRCYTPLASLDREKAAEWLPRHAGLFLDPNRIRVSEEEVEMRTLDSFGLTPAFMKIDVEGVTLAVLRGALRTLAEHKPVLLVERAKDDGVAELLAPFGYREYGPDGPGLTPYRGQKDALFVVPDSPNMVISVET